MVLLAILRAMSSNRRFFLILAALAALFALRVVAQATQRWHVLPFLPPFDAFQGSALPYELLLSSQIAILAVMALLAWQVRADKIQRRAGVGRALAIAGWIYGSVMLIRLCIGFAAPAAAGWFKVWIPSIFHLVLAAFVLALAAYHRERRLGHADRDTP
jgi:hypothetical protein